MPSPEEQKDLDELKAAMNKVKIDCFDNLRYYQRLDEQGKKSSGHTGKSNAEIMAWCYDRAQADIKRLTNEFLKKWPDD